MRMIRPKYNPKPISTMMKLNLVLRSLRNFFVGLFLVATLLLMGCGDDPEPANEEELITTLTVTLTPDEGTPITLTFKDLDGDGPGAPVFTYSPSTGGGDPAALLEADKVYQATIELLNEAENPVENVTEEIEEEADEHLFCFEKSGLTNLSIVYDDTEADYLTGGSSKKVGLRTTWTTGAAETGTVKIYLRHQPGTKTGDCPGSGETDIEVTFKIAIQ